MYQLPRLGQTKRTYNFAGRQTWGFTIVDHRNINTMWDTDTMAYYLGWKISNGLVVPEDCPPDVEALGRSTWTLLHTIAATYPSNATPAQQCEMKTFLSVFSRIYPCWVCAEDFRGWIGKSENKLQVEGGGSRGHLSGRKEFALWMCNAHNDVNQKLGKNLFDCSKVEERWRTGWKDGRCDWKHQDSRRNFARLIWVGREATFTLSE